MVTSTFLADMSEFRSNSRIEAFANHLRNLIVFLYPDEYPLKKDDVAAHHFVSAQDGYTRWLARRPPLSSSLRAAKVRADKELAHLTVKRISGTPPSKAWPMKALAEEIRQVFGVFISVADPNRVGDRVCQAVPDQPLGGP